MLDIIPSSSSGAAAGRRRGVKRSRPSENVVKLDWRLPARLRKPIKQQIAAERQRLQTKAGFESRPLTTRHLLGGRAGQEPHTRDTHGEAEPGVRLAAPPYAGQFLRTFSPRGADVPYSKSQKVAPAPARLTQPQPAPMAKPASPVKRVPARAAGSLPISFERDVHYNWGLSDSEKGRTYFEEADEATEVPLPATPASLAHAEVQKPRRFSLPFSLNIIPRGLLPNFQRREARQPEPSKKKLELRR